jgi:hypothetical protein
VRPLAGARGTRPCSVRSPLAAAALLLASCGDDDDDGSAAPPPAAAPLDPAFSGTWTGTTTVSSTAVDPLSFPSALVIAASGQTATVSAICPDGSGSVVAQGSGRSAQWQGSTACPPLETDVCSAVTLTFQNATLTLNEDGTLTTNAAGIATGCAITVPVTFTFDGTK